MYHNLLNQIVGSKKKYVLCNEAKATMLTAVQRAVNASFKNPEG